MPAGQPFTLLCQLTAGARRARADLHAHTTHSDGSLAPADLVATARSAGLLAVAVTDHDTMTGVPEALEAARRLGNIEVVPGVEITAEHAGAELHLLGYFLRHDDPNLSAALGRLCEARAGRFWEMAARLRANGLSADEADVRAVVGPRTALGRVQLAAYLVATKQAATIQQAFSRWLTNGAPAEVPKARLPVAEAVALVRAAGGVSSWAHPPVDATAETLAELAGLGLQAVEVEYPNRKAGRLSDLRQRVLRVGLLVTGGSDTHGPGARPVGAAGVGRAELEALRRLAGQ